MSHIDIVAIERHARQLRAAEIRRIEGLFAERMLVLGRLLAGSAFAGALALAGMLRPLFSWNPQNPVAKVAVKPAPAKRSTHSLFDWNPEVHHHL